MDKNLHRLSCSEMGKGEVRVNDMDISEDVLLRNGQRQRNKLWKMLNYPQNNEPMIKQANSKEPKRGVWELAWVRTW